MVQSIAGATQSMNTKRIMPIRVIVVDDSLFMRTLISDMLNSDPDIEVVDTARNGREAVSKTKAKRPDCITLDLIMPVQDGVSTVKQIMEECPTPCVILSAHSRKDADITIECLNAGAVGFVVKPSGELSLNIENAKTQLLEAVKAASTVELKKIQSLASNTPERHTHRWPGADTIVVIGASTGGPQTLESILPSLPAEFPSAIIVVQHLPDICFTESFAKRLRYESDLSVKVAENNEIIRAGTIYLAPGGHNLKLRMLPNERITAYISQVEGNVLTPSIDLAMESAVEVCGGNVIGIILTGIGSDGCRGMGAIKQSGGRTIVQDESSLIYGMPKAVIDAGLADEVLPASRIGKAMIECVYSGRHARYEQRETKLCPT